MKNFSRIFVTCAIAFASVVAVYGVDSFIIGGWPVAEASVSACSEPATVTSGRLSEESNPGALDVRFKSDHGSVDAIAFDTFPPKGFMIIVR